RVETTSILALTRRAHEIPARKLSAALRAASVSVKLSMGGARFGQSKEEIHAGGDPRCGGRFRVQPLRRLERAGSHRRGGFDRMDDQEDQARAVSDGERRRGTGRTLPLDDRRGGGRSGRTVVPGRNRNL